MINKLLILILSFIFVQSSFAQFSLEKFLDEPFNLNYKTVKSNLKGKDLEETTILKFKSVVFYDYLDPVSVKVGYLFDVDNSQKGKVIMNGKENEKDSEKLFEILLAALEKKFSKNYSKTELGDMIMINWKGLKDLSVILSKQANKTMMTIVRK
ncbi:MAG: hypothetical protein WHV63_04160 [Ignavibacteria bacterium]|jgi:hypothetical protein|nr:hypothetical protein [Ignavibacteria bacterium]MDH7526663.1 hypothetical protein [Ignavibacteria bacterium]NPV11500.1 hypothetical protein [Ignavibacteria bacterium]